MVLLCLRTYITLLTKIYYFFQWDMVIHNAFRESLKNPSKVSAYLQMPCSLAFRLKDWIQEFFNQGLESFSRIGVPPILRESVVLKDIFFAETFHDAYLSAGMPMDRAFAEWLKYLKEK